jgi:hypothetical protein
MLENHERESSDHIVVAIFQRMQSDATIKDYTIRVFNSWGVGQKGKNNGVCVVAQALSLNAIVLEPYNKLPKSHSFAKGGRKMQKMFIAPAQSPSESVPIRFSPLPEVALGAHPSSESWPD